MNFSHIIQKVANFTTSIMGITKNIFEEASCMTIILAVLALFLAVAVVLGLVFGVGAWLISVSWKVIVVIAIIWGIIKVIKYFFGKE